MVDSPVLMRLAESAARVEEAVAGLRRDVESLRDDFSSENDKAHASRKDVHVKIDTLTSRTGELEKTVQIAGQLTAQTRDIIDETVMPVVTEFIAMKWRGAGMLSAAAVAGSVLFWVLTTYGTKILAALKIG